MKLITPSGDQVAVFKPCTWNQGRSGLKQRRNQKPRQMSTTSPETINPSRRTMYHRYDQMITLSRIQSGPQLRWTRWPAYVRTSIFTDADATATLPRSWNYGEIPVCTHEREQKRTVPPRYSARNSGVSSSSWGDYWRCKEELTVAVQRLARRLEEYTATCRRWFEGSLGCDAHLAITNPNAE